MIQQAIPFGLGQGDSAMGGLGGYENICSSLSPRLRQISPLAPRIPAIARPVPVKSHRRASVGAPHFLFLSGCQLVQNAFYTLPRAIKEEKKNEAGVGSSEIKKREQGWPFSFGEETEEKGLAIREKRKKRREGKREKERRVRKAFFFFFWVLLR